MTEKKSAELESGYPFFVNFFNTRFKPNRYFITRTDTLPMRKMDPYRYRSLITDIICFSFEIVKIFFNQYKKN